MYVQPAQYMSSEIYVDMLRMWLLINRDHIPTAITMRQSVFCAEGT